MKKTVLILLSVVLVGLAFAAYKGSTYVTANDCVGCGDCELVCPTNAITIFDGKAVIDVEKCIDCEICIKTCTYGAIKKTK